MNRMPLRRAALLTASVLILTTSASVVTTAGSGHDLEIDIVPSQSTVVPETNVALTLTVKNNGPIPAAQANVTSSAPAGTRFVSVESSTGTVNQAPAPGETGDIAVGLGPLTVNQTETVTIVLTFVAAPGSTVTVESEVQPLNPMGDPIQSNNHSQTGIMLVAPTTADLALAATGEDPTAGTGSLFGYTLTVTNPNPAARSPRDPATGVVVSAHTPDGSVFASASSSQGNITAPPVGQPGLVVLSAGALEEGASATFEVTVTVSASPGSTLSLSAHTSSAAIDPDTSNNTAEVLTPVVDNGTAALSWEAPVPPSDAVPLPPPLRLEVVRSGTPARTWSVADPRATLQGYNVYRANTPGVAPSPATFFVSVPAGQTNTTAPVAPGGSFFTVTAMYDTGESGPSNEGSADIAAATITNVKVKSSKIQATGAGFTDVVSVFVDGIPFVAAAAVKKQGAKVIQKGNLLTGQTIGAYLAANPSVLISFRNSNGGVATYRHPQ